MVCYLWRITGHFLTIPVVLIMIWTSFPYKKQLTFFTNLLKLESRRRRTSHRSTFLCLLLSHKYTRLHFCLQLSSNVVLSCVAYCVCRLVTKEKSTVDQELFKYWWFTLSALTKNSLILFRKASKICQRVLKGSLGFFRVLVGLQGSYIKGPFCRMLRTL